MAAAVLPNPSPGAQAAYAARWQRTLELALPFGVLAFVSRWALGPQRVQTRPNTTAAFCPPNAKLVDSTTSTRCSRAVCGM